MSLLKRRVEEVAREETEKYGALPERDALGNFTDEAISVIKRVNKRMARIIGVSAKGLAEASIDRYARYETIGEEIRHIKETALGILRR